MNTITENAPTPNATVQPAKAIVPRVNIHQDEEGYTLKAEMPGVSKDGVEVTVEDGQLKIVGRRKEEATLGRAVYRERSSAEYRRTFDLDRSIDHSKVSAHIEQGLLTVRLLKSEALKPRRITVS